METSSMNLLKKCSVDTISTRNNSNGDIFEHLLTLQKCARECNSVIELGVISCVSSYPIITGLLGNKGKRMVSTGVKKNQSINDFEFLARNVIDYNFFEGNDLDYPITEDFDMVFIDTWHVRGQLQRELAKFAPRCNKYIAMHDTSVDEFVGESIRCGHNIAQEVKDSGFSLKEIQDGLWPAVMDFLESNPEWKIKVRYLNNNGLTILERAPKVITSTTSEVARIMRENKCKDVVLCTFGDNKVFLEITRTLCNQLNDSGVSCLITANVDEYSPTTLYILYNSHNYPARLPSHIKYVVFNYEQAGSTYIRQQHYIDKMSLGLCVFDYSEFNKSYLETIINKRVIIVPYSYHSSLSILPLDLTNTEEYDIVFYGAMNENRKAYQDILAATEYKVKFDFGYGLFGNDLMQALKRAKIVLNLHYYQDPSILELSRIIPLVSNYKLVLSERSSDFHADERFKDIIEFINKDTILEVCRRYLEDPLLRQAKVMKAFELFSSERL